tara:strand:- start:119 stop:355 length:237 start_codon:yes stop_codon:yes gene_type:complete
VGPEAALEFGAVAALHHEDEVGPVDQFGGALFVRIAGKAGGGGLDAGVCREQLLGRGRAEAVAGTEEEEVGQDGIFDQ